MRSPPWKLRRNYCQPWWDGFFIEIRSWSFSYFTKKCSCNTLSLSFAETEKNAKYLKKANVRYGPREKQLLDFYYKGEEQGNNKFLKNKSMTIVSNFLLFHRCARDRVYPRWLLARIQQRFVSLLGDSVPWKWISCYFDGVWFVSCPDPERTSWWD